MAIVFDSTTTSTATSFSHTTSGTDRLLVVGVFANTADGTLTGITYNGVSLTLINTKAVNAGTQYVSLYYLTNPASGTNTVAKTGTDTGCSLTVASYTGVHQSSSLDAIADGTAGSATSVSTTLTTVENNALVVAHVRGDAGDAKSNNSGVAGTNRDATSNKFFWDSNGGVGVAGGKTVSYSAGASQGWGLVTASFAPSATSTFRPHLMSF